MATTFLSIKIEDLANNTAFVLVQDEDNWILPEDDTWSASPTGSIGRTDHGDWSFFPAARFLNLEEGGVTVLQLRGFPISPRVGDQGDGLHATPGRRIDDGVIGWKITGKS